MQERYYTVTYISDTAPSIGVNPVEVRIHTNTKTNTGVYTQHSIDTVDKAPKNNNESILIAPNMVAYKKNTDIQ